MKNLFKVNSFHYITLVLFAALTYTANAQTNTKNEAQENNEAKFLDADDSKLLVDAYSSGMLEIKLAESIKTRTVMDEIKTLAGTIIATHTDINKQIRELATKNKISLPTQLTKAQQNDVDNFNNQSAVDVNEEYVDLLVTSHKKSLDLFEKGTEADDTDIRALFVKGLPTIREHHDMANNLNDNMKKQDQEQRKSDTNMN